jgi:hypothetical protein
MHQMHSDKSRPWIRDAASPNGYVVAVNPGGTHEHIQPLTLPFFRSNIRASEDTNSDIEDTGSESTMTSEGTSDASETESDGRFGTQIAVSDQDVLATDRSTVVSTADAVWRGDWQTGSLSNIGPADAVQVMAPFHVVKGQPLTYITEAYLDVYISL